MSHGTGGQGKEQAWFGIEALRQIWADVTENRRECLEGRPIRKRIHETIEVEGTKVNVDLAERGAIAASRSCDPKPAISYCEHEGNSEMMILTSNVKQMWGHRRALLATLRDGGKVRPIECSSGETVALPRIDDVGNRLWVVSGSSPRRSSLGVSAASQVSSRSQIGTHWNALTKAAKRFSQRWRLTR
jgi:hypothetical protein